MCVSKDEMYKNVFWMHEHKGLSPCTNTRYEMTSCKDFLLNAKMYVLSYSCLNGKDDMRSRWESELVWFLSRELEQAHDYW